MTSIWGDQKVTLKKLVYIYAMLHECFGRSGVIKLPTLEGFFPMLRGMVMFSEKKSEL